MGARKGSPRLVTRRRLLAAGGALAACALMGGRIAYVNANPPFDIPVVHHEIGEWVELDGAFLMNASSEATAGYAVRVVSFEVMARNEYARRYATDDASPIEGCDVDSLVCVELDIKNADSKGGLDLLSMVLVPGRKNDQLVYDTSLYLAGETALRENASFTGYIAVRPGTEYSTRVPFMPRSNYIEVDGATIPQSYVTPLDDTTFELRLSNTPVRHVVDLRR